MGSVITYIECPNCKSEYCSEDYYYKTGEMYTKCSQCGYTNDNFFKRDDKGQFIKIDKTKGDTFDNFEVVHIHIPNPYGVYEVHAKDSVGYTIGTLVDEKQYQEFYSEIVSLSNQENILKKAIVRRFINNEIVEEVLFQL